MKITKALALILAAIICLAAITACTKGETNTDGTADTTNTQSSADNQETQRFDYFNEDMTKYISIDESQYKGFAVTLLKELMPGEEGVQAYIDVLRANYSTSTGNKITDRAVAEGDTVALYYEGWLDGEKFEGGSNMDDESPYPLVIGSGSFIPGFEEALIGIIPAETSRDNLVDLNLTFPESYHSADLAGKAVVFKVYIEYIDEKAPAEYTEKFITETLQYTTTDEDVKASFEKYIEEEVIPSVRKNEILNQLWEKLFELAVVTEYPETEVAYYYEQYIAEYEYYEEYFAYIGQKFNTFDEFVCAYLGLADGTDWKAVTTDNAKIDVSQNLIFHYIAQKEGLTVTEADYNASVQYYIDYYASQGTTLTAADVETYFGSNMVRSQALFDKVNNLLVENCTVTYEE
jgi:trigger factor